MKSRSEFICQQCGYKSSSYLGKCPECGEWNSLVETAVSGSVSAIKYQVSSEESLIKLSEVKSSQTARTATGYSEFDRVLGGGIVPGSIILVSGEPGIGKSTLLLQTAMKIAQLSVIGSRLSDSGQSVNQLASLKTGKPKTDKLKSDNRQQKTDNSVLYVTGEESAQQVKIRADRIGKIPSNLFVLSQTDVDAVQAVCEKVNPSLLIVDSIQTLTSEELSGTAGSVGQVRQCAQILQRLAKGSKVPIFLVGHVTKEGNIAGPKVLEHLVDAVLNLEGDSSHAFRMLRCIKNRFGSTFEVGVFEMADSGMIEVANPSQIFLAQRLKSRAGSVVCATVAGGRPLLCEVQALTTTTIFGMPTRRVTGLDFNRMQIVIAALTRSVNLPLANLDVYLNVAGGLKIEEPAVDLAAALALTSAALDKPLAEGICAFGEVGLLGELRAVSNSNSRMNEAKRLGFSQFLTADKFKTLEEVVNAAIHGG